MNLQVTAIRQDLGLVSSEGNVCHDMTLREIEKSVILETLRRQKFNRTRTAKVLGIGIRTLQRKLKQYREIDADIVVNYPVAS